MVTRQSARRINFNDAQQDVDKTGERHAYIGISKGNQYKPHNFP